METNEYLKKFYEEYDEDGRLVSKHGKVEYVTTMKYISKYLHPGMRILEVGAATGRYSHVLAQKGYRVDAVELLEHNIAIFKHNTIKDSLSPSCRATQWTCQHLKTIFMTSLCCLDRCTIYLQQKIN